MKLAIVDMINKVGQEYQETYLVDDIKIHGDVEKALFDLKGVYDYEQPNEHGNQVMTITLSDSLEFLFEDELELFPVRTLWGKSD